MSKMIKNVKSELKLFRILMNGSEVFRMIGWSIEEAFVSYIGSLDCVKKSNIEKIEIIVEGVSVDD